MTNALRLTAVLTHPVQYYAPWFRQIASGCRDLDLTVLYATQPTPSQQGAGFGNSFTWDTPLTEGYRHRVLRPAQPGDNVHSDSFWGVHVMEIGQAIRESRPDVVMVCGWYSVTLLRALWTCRRLKIPVLYRGDTNLDSAPTGWRQLAWCAKTGFLLRRFDGYLSVGQRVDDFLQYFKIPRAKSFRVPHCVDNAFFKRASKPYQTPADRTAARQFLGLSNDAFVVLFVGKLEQNKRPLDAIRAVQRLGVNSFLLVVGCGPLEEECRKQAAELGVKVIWMGFQNQSELGRVYAVADCLVLPSESETWGLVVNEAMATGLPCVVSDRVGCAPDLIETGETGEVFPFGDVNNLSKCLHRVRQDLRCGHAYDGPCRQRVAGYSYESATRGLVAACKSVTSRGGGSGIRDGSNTAENDTTATHLQQKRNGSSSAKETQRRLAGQSRPCVLALCGHMVSVFGIERMTFEVLRELREHHTPVHCIVNDWENHRIVSLAEKIGATWSTGYYRTALIRHTRNPIKLLKMLFGATRTNADLMREIIRFRPTHILAPEFMSVLRNAPALAILRACGVRVLLRVGNAPDSSQFYQKLWRFVIDPLVDRFVCNSKFTLSKLRGLGIRESKSTYVYNTLPARSSPVPNDVQRDPRKIIFVGQIIPPKGLHLLLDAVALIATSGQDVRLDVVGDISGWEAPTWEGYHQRLLQRAEQPDLAGRVHFLGYRDDVVSLMRRASIHCCPSTADQNEAFGVVNLEAKRAGLPTVAFNYGALPELVSHKENGWICAELSAEALAEGLVWLLSDRQRCAAARHSAQQSLSKFGAKPFSVQWLSEFGIINVNSHSAASSSKAA